MMGVAYPLRTVTARPAHIKSKTLESTNRSIYFRWVLVLYGNSKLNVLNTHSFVHSFFNLLA